MAWQGTSRGLRALIAGLCVLALLLPTEAGADERPNFVHVLTDDQTIDSLDFMGNVQRLLAAEGTTFTQHHAVQPLCCPSRASFLTGQYPHNHGVLDNLPPGGYDSMDFSRTLYTAMHGAGYRTGWLGKVLNAYGEQGVKPEPGFDEWLTPIRGSELDMFNYTLSDNGAVVEVNGTYQNDVYASRAAEFIASSATQPFLLTLGVFSPHWSLCPPGVVGRCDPQPAPQDLGTFAGAQFPFGKNFRGTPAERADVNAYWQRELEALQSVDRIVGALVEQLRAQGELDNTYFIFQSDNGMLHGEHGVDIDKNVPWDRSVRVPLVIRGPGFEAGAVRDDLTANIDIPATILDAAGVASPRPLDGYSLLEDNRRRALLLERVDGGQARRSQAWKQIKTAAGWTYWRYPGSNRRYLFDLERDPFQVHNRVRREPDRVRRLQRRINKFSDCAAPCP